MTGWSSRLTVNCGVSPAQARRMSARQAASCSRRFSDRRGFVVGHVVHLAAEGVERGHGVAFGARQQQEGEREIGGAFAGDRAAVRHDREINVGVGCSSESLSSVARRWQAADLRQRGIGLVLIIVLTAAAAVVARVFAEEQDPHHGRQRHQNGRPHDDYKLRPRLIAFRPSRYFNQVPEPFCSAASGGSLAAPSPRFRFNRCIR